MTRRALVVIALLLIVLGTASSAGAWVYWANNSGLVATIGRGNLDGSAVNLAFAKGTAQPCGIAVDSAHLYWADETAQTIGRANLDGTAANPSFITGAKSPCGVAVDAAHLYWANTDLGNGSTIGRANLDGSGVDQSFITGAMAPCGVAVDGVHIYWGNYGPGFGRGKSIGRANLDGSAVNNDFITGANGPCGVAVDATHVYWANTGPLGSTSGGTIGRANLDGSGANSSFITGANDPCGIAVDQSHIYWGNTGPKERSTTIGRANLDGTGVDESFITGASGPCGVAVDSGDSGPSNSFTLGKAVLNTRSGTAVLTVTVPGPGVLVLSGRGVRSTRAVTAHNGQLAITVRPVGQAAVQLKKLHKAKVSISVTYTPTGGTPDTRRTAITLRLRGSR